MRVICRTRRHWLRCDAGDVEADPARRVGDLLEQPGHLIDGRHEPTHHREILGVPPGVFLELAQVAGLEFSGGGLVGRRESIDVGCLLDDGFRFRREHVEEEDDAQRDREQDHGEQGLFALGEGVEHLSAPTG